MGEQPGRVVQALRSPRAENVFGVLLVAFLSTATVFLLATGQPHIDWSVAAAPMAIYLVGLAVAATMVVLLTDRISSQWLRDTRDRARHLHIAITVMWIPIGLLFALGTASSFAEELVCFRGDGVVVQTSLTESDHESGVRSGVYEYDGEIYDLDVADEEWIAGQVAPEVPPSDDNPYFTRSYRVPWGGSSLVCSHDNGSTKGDLVGISVAGLLGAVAVLLATRSLWRRRVDESEAGGESVRA